MDDLKTTNKGLAEQTPYIVSNPRGLFLAFLMISSASTVTLAGIFGFLGETVGVYCSLGADVIMLTMALFMIYKLTIISPDDFDPERQKNKQTTIYLQKLAEIELRLTELENKRDKLQYFRFIPNKKEERNPYEYIFIYDELLCFWIKETGLKQGIDLQIFNLFLSLKRNSIKRIFSQQNITENKYLDSNMFSEYSVFIPLADIEYRNKNSHTEKEKQMFLEIELKFKKILFTEEYIEPDIQKEIILNPLDMGDFNGDGMTDIISDKKIQTCEFSLLKREKIKCLYLQKLIEINNLSAN